MPLAISTCALEPRSTAGEAEEGTLPRDVGAGVGDCFRFGGGGACFEGDCFRFGGGSACFEGDCFRSDAMRLLVFGDGACFEGDCFRLFMLCFERVGDVDAGTGVPLVPARRVCDSKSSSVFFGTLSRFFGGGAGAGVILPLPAAALFRLPR
jgi:hypothetical protein